jgi:predicted O-methyltransferase YrrM
MKYNIDNKPEEDFPVEYRNGVADFFKKGNKDINNFICEGIFNSTMFPLQRKKEMSLMLGMADNLQPRVVMEIGCDKGGSLYHWCRLPSVKRVIAIEFRGTPYHEEFEKEFPNIDFCFIHGSSYDERNVEIVKNFLGKDKIDAAFLDGDKLWFFEDYSFYRPMMKDGGFMFLHDINGEPPQEAFQKISDIEDTLRIIDTTEALSFSKNPTNSWEEWLKYWGTTSCGVGVVKL